MFVIVERGIVEAVSVDKDEFPAAIDAPADIICGDLYSDGEFQRVAPRPEPPPDMPYFPPVEEYLIDVDYRLSKIELGI